jgi:hypothetical protein
VELEDWIRHRPKFTGTVIAQSLGTKLPPRLDNAVSTVAKHSTPYIYTLEMAHLILSAYSS